MLEKERQKYQRSYSAYLFDASSILVYLKMIVNRLGVSATMPTIVTRRYMGYNYKENKVIDDDPANCFLSNVGLGNVRLKMRA